MASPASAKEGPAAQAERRRNLLKALFAVACAVAIYFRFELFIWLILWPLIGAAALWWGRWEERVVLLAFAANLAVTRFFYGLATPNADLIGVDSIFLAVLIIVAVRSDRWWPSWAAAFQFATVATRLLFMAPAGHAIEVRAYLVSVVIWTWLLFIALGVGAFDRWSERNRQRDSQRRGRSALMQMTFLAGFAFAVWYAWPALPKRLAELGVKPIAFATRHAPNELRESR